MPRRSASRTASASVCAFCSAVTCGTSPSDCQAVSCVVSAPPAVVALAGLPVERFHLTAGDQQALGATSHGGERFVFIDRTALAAHEILQDLTLLSLKGFVKRVDGQTFVKRSG